MCPKLQMEDDDDNNNTNNNNNNNNNNTKAHSTPEPANLMLNSCSIVQTVSQPIKN